MLRPLGQLVPRTKGILEMKFTTQNQDNTDGDHAVEAPADCPLSLNIDVVNAVDHFVRYASEDETEFNLLAWPREYVDCGSALWDEANDSAQEWIRALCGGEEAYRATMSSWPAAGVMQCLINEILWLQRFLCEQSQGTPESANGAVESVSDVPEQEAGKGGRHGRS